MSAPDPLLASPHSRGYVLYAIFVIFLVCVFNVVDRYILSVLAPMMKADLGLSDSQMGWLLGPSFSVVHFLAVLPAAWLADRTARRTIVAVGLFVWSTMTALGAMAQGFGTLFLTRMGVGLGEAAGSPPSAGLLSDTAPPAWRTRALSSLTIGALVGVAAGMIVGGAVGQSHGWRAALVAVGLPGIALALLVRFTLREPPRGDVASASPAEAARHLFGWASFRWAVAGVCVANVAIAGRNLWEPSFLDRAYGLSGAELGLTYVAISALPSMLGAGVGATLADRLGERDPRWIAWVCGGSLLAGTPFLVAFLLWDPSHRVQVAGASVPVGFAASVVGSFLLGFFSAPMATLAQMLATTRMRSMAHAMWTMPFSLIGMGLGPLLVGSLSEAWSTDGGAEGLRNALVVASGLLPIGAAGFFVAARSLRTEIARAASKNEP